MSPKEKVVLSVVETEIALLEVVALCLEPDGGQYVHRARELVAGRIDELREIRSELVRKGVPGNGSS